jgi:SSS family solute:Na+ symporter
MGLMLSSYFSAILSTADSCLMAASGNIVTDIIAKFSKKELTHKKKNYNYHKLVTSSRFVCDLASISNAKCFRLMLYSYAFMVSGLFVPVIGALFGKKSSNSCFGYAIWRKHHNFTNSHQNKLPLGIKLPEHLDANIYGLTVSLILFLTISYYHNNKKIKQMEFKIINQNTVADPIYTSRLLHNFYLHIWKSTAIKLLIS